ncbi:MAG: hypothetical protein HY460_01165 [Parcubacteria group bacterium]|nr:hypothetical protein [Parcubacteria group bacterium]
MIGANFVSVRIDIRSSLSLVVFAIIAVSMTVFILNRANVAIDEINALSQQPAYLGLDEAEQPGG